MSTTPDYAGLNLIAEAITEWFGERCPDYAEGCHSCEAWKEYDRLRTLLESNAALERERDTWRNSLQNCTGNTRSPISLCRRPSMTEISEKEVQALAEVLLGRVNAPEQEIYRAARDGLEAAARVRAEANAGEPVEVLDAPIAKGLLSNEDAKAAGLGRFGHHPNPAIDFEIEVESLQSRLFDAKHGISKPGGEVEEVASVLEDIRRAMTFRVGGDVGAVRAKQFLRGLEAEALRAALKAQEGEG